jgi:hypothetical protein
MMHSTRIVSVMLRRQRLTTYMHGACQFDLEAASRVDFSRKSDESSGGGLSTP